MRIAKFTSAGYVFLFILFLTGALMGQEAKWERSIDKGDEAMANQHYDEAEAAYRDALAFAEKRWKKDARISASLWKIAESCNAQGKQDEAESLAKRSALSMEDAVSDHKPRNASEECQEVVVSTGLFEKAGDFFAGKQRYEDAESLYKKSLNQWKKYLFGTAPQQPKSEEIYRFWLRVAENIPEKFVGAGLKLGSIYQKEGNVEGAKSLYQELATATDKLYKSTDPHNPTDSRIVPLLTNIGSSEFRVGDYAGAEPLFKRVIDVLAESKYKDSPDMASALENYALLLKKTGRAGAAKPFLERAAVIRANSTIVRP